MKWVVGLLVFIVCVSAALAFEPSKDVIDAASVAIVKQGISQQYFDQHFLIVGASILNGSQTDWTSLELDYNYSVGEYSIPYIGMATRDCSSCAISYVFPSTQLHEIATTVSSAEAHKQLDSCFVDGVDQGIQVLPNGNLRMTRAGYTPEHKRLLAKLDPETGALSCSVNKFPTRTLMSIGIGLIIIVIVIFFLRRRKPPANPGPSPAMNAIPPSDAGFKPPNDPQTRNQASPLSGSPSQPLANSAQNIPLVGPKP